MHKQLSIWQFALSNIQQNIAVQLLYVVESNGSSPGRQGFFMLVNARGEMCGSIGGGMMEHKLVELAKDKLQKEDQCVHLKEQLHQKNAIQNQSGMICSGGQTVVLISLSAKDIQVLLNITGSLQQHKNGTLELSEKGIHFLNDAPIKPFFYTKYSDTAFLYRQQTGYTNKLFIVGGGHCALALSKIMNSMDFYIYLIEERDGLNTYAENCFVHEKSIIENYSKLNDYIPFNSNSYVVIMTFGYRTDAIALRSIIHQNFKYIGVLGSKSKMQTLLQQLEQEGISSTLLKSIHTPIGIQIKSETPEEIAISIAAEIIAVKNKHNASKLQ